MLNLRPRIENSGAGAMSNRSKTANVAAAVARGRRPDLGAWALALLMLMTGIAVPGALRADVIVLKNGESIEGSIIDATRNTVIVRRAIGGMRQMPIQDIEEVRIDLGQGAVITGQIVSWVDGVSQVRSGGEVVRIRAGRILTRERAQEATRQAPRALPPRPEEEEPAVATAAASAAEPRAAEQAAAERTVAEPRAAARTAAGSPAAGTSATESPSAESRAEETTAAESTAAEATADRSPARGSSAGQQAERDGQAVAVKASVDPAAAGAADVVFKIELSRPAEQTVVLIYGTVDGTAKAGQDYEAQQGVVTLAPGARSAAVHVPLIEPQRPRGDTRFELFLAADPKVAEVVDPRITATIPGDD